MERNTYEMDDLSWEKCNHAGSFTISTRPELLEHDFINTAFASEEMYWAKPVPHSQLVTLLSNSITLGLYERQPVKSAPGPEEEQPLPPRSSRSSEDRLKQIGMARFITDHVTTAYLTDVYVAPAHRKSGLGRWLVACCHEVIEAHPALRRVLLAATPQVGKPFYAQELGMWDVAEEKETLAIMSRKKFKALGE
ncbi:hypothetical protein D0860_07524 [Hortaea werneckii]|uniref:N-acetyltransferase domain-containing protein n=2 Tax=Hortaea werneckii TaxID=91943 RepID=A0A3M7GKB2_HORWE|nr:hypothetical protein D0860_07524 [Hortaea werneckii]